MKARCCKKVQEKKALSWLAPCRTILKVSLKYCSDLYIMIQCHEFINS